MRKSVGEESKKKNKLVVLDANFYWTEQLFSSCSVFFDVLLLRPVDFRAFKRRYGGYFIDLKPQLIAEGVWEQRICCPPGWLFHYWYLTQLFFSFLIRQFQGQEKLIFVFNFPYYHTLINSLNCHSIYYSIDDYSQYWANRQEQTEKTEALAITKADMVLCVSEYRQNLLKQKLPSQSNKIVHLPHGCSIKFMVDQPLEMPKSLPDSLKNYSRPIAGYIGALNYRFDFLYLAEVAEKLPEITFVLGGDLPTPNDGSPQWWQGVEKIKRLPNVHFIGRVNHDQLGKYLQCFDVLLMVYSHCEFNLNACPTKLWDYMGTSLPIVVNNFVPEVNRWSDLLRISNNCSHFAENIRLSLANPQWKSSERLETAKAHTWKKQAGKLLEMIERFFLQT
jgi:glycosyltransferase involved in cell wall biosynthesis